MIEIKNLEKKFGKLQVLRDFNLSFEVGKSYALMGPNGSGKTTLIKSILGMVLPTSGQILINGQSIKGSWAYRENIGYMPQIGRYPDNMSVGQLLDMMKNIRHSHADLDETLIRDFDLTSMLGKPMHSLSGGTRQKVSAALAFLFKPQVLILDEPTAGLDPLAVEILKNKINEEREKGRLVIITSHILSELEELTDHAIYINEGGIVYNKSIAELKDETNEKKFGAAIAQIMKQAGITTSQQP